MKALVSGLLISLVYSALIAAQGRDRAVERISVALDQPSAIGLGASYPPSTAPRTVGVFTLLAPMGRGEILRVSVPIGEMVTRAFKGAAAANRRRHASAVRRDIEAELESFKKWQTARK